MNSSEADATMTGGGLTARWMEMRGLNHLFQVPGETFLSILDGVRTRPSINVITNRHESGASFAAEAFAKISGKPAICIATRGPGASNLSIGVQTAYYDGTPMIVLLGLIPTYAVGSRAFQEYDPLAMYNSISKRVMSVQSLRSLPQVLDQALIEATSARPGPVVVGLPMDILDAKAEELSDAPCTTHRSHDVSYDATQVADLLMKATRPIVLVGTEAVRGATADYIEQFATLTGLPMFSSWRRFSAVDNSHPLYVGPIGRGAMPGVVAAASEADLVLSFGFALDDITTEICGWHKPGVTMVQFASAAEPEIGRRVTGARVDEITIQPEQAASSLVAWARDNQDRCGELRIRHEVLSMKNAAVCRPGIEIRSNHGRVHTDYLFQQLDRMLPDNAIVVSDAGNFSQWLLRHVRYGGSRVFAGPLNGAMGYALPGAIGSVLADRSRPVWCIMGDGGAMMTASEIATAAAHGLAISALVVDNGVYGTIRGKQAADYSGRFVGTSLGGVDFAALARSVGWTAWTATTDQDVPDVLSRAVAGKGCRLVHALVEELPLSPS